MSGLNWLGAIAVVVSLFIVACGGVLIGLLGVFVGCIVAGLDWERI